ncbi:helix-turn-helix domain-containing transcriptional regulator [Acidisoma silvae]|uniref:Transcriptional regulator n=1 Tax=Acidisoma silvae TaxID=2802396 RepID=A0A963YTK4_9PROT|nr:transcriptional regulator [Acidisoma silvae]MCB8876709.1 transcriptional regulator [Acidisoma silvae]
MAKSEPFDLAPCFGSSEASLDLLNDAFASCDAGYVLHALSLVAHAQDKNVVAQSLSEDGDPRLTTLLGVTGALGFRLAVIALDDEGIAAAG